jgi:methionine-gamma-lyase
MTEKGPGRMTSGERRSGFQTVCLHAGRKASKSMHVATPISLSTSFEFSSASEAAEQAADIESDEFYGRWGSINAREFEAIVAALEGGEDAVCAGSGLAIISMVLHAFLRSGDHFVGSRQCYSEALILQRELCAQMNVEATFVDSTDLEEIGSAITAKTKLVHVETPANPALSLADIEEVVALARTQSDAVVVVDSTFASPYNQQPLSLGADVVLHSATKYIGGHSDVVAGVAVARQELAWKIRKCFSFHGPHLDPFAAWLLCRGLKTLGIRMERHNTSAMRLAEHLRTHPLVSKVSYPFLASHPQHDLAVRQMSGGGGMVCFELRGGSESALRLLEELKIIKMAVSLGSADSLLAHPASMTHNLLSPRQLAEAGISAGTMRLSVGLEDPDDLEADLGEALTIASEAQPAGPSHAA